MGKAEEAATTVTAAVVIGLRRQQGPRIRQGDEEVEETVLTAGAGVEEEAGVRDDAEGTPQAMPPPQMPLAPPPVDATTPTEVADGRSAVPGAGGVGAAAAATADHRILSHPHPLAGTPEKAGEREAARRAATPTIS